MPTKKKRGSPARADTSKRTRRLADFATDQRAGTKSAFDLFGAATGLGAPGTTDGVIKKPRQDAFRAAVDALDLSLECAATTIKGLKLGVSAEVRIEERAHSVDGMATYLVWGRQEETGVRMLHLEAEADDGGRFMVDLARAPLRAREAAAQAVPLLVERLKVARAGRAAEIQAAADELEQYLNGIES